MFLLIVSGCYLLLCCRNMSRLPIIQEMGMIRGHYDDDVAGGGRKESTNVETNR